MPVTVTRVIKNCPRTAAGGLSFKPTIDRGQFKTSNPLPPAHFAMISNFVRFLILSILATACLGEIRGQDAGNDVTPPTVPTATPATGTPSSDPSSPDLQSPTVPELLQQLDSQKFALRESATQQLIERGEASLRPAAIYYFKGLPEPNWRIKRVLESISTTGDEAVFLKTAVILQLLYATQNPDIEQQISQLQMQWRLSRRNAAIRDLTNAGLQIESFNNNDLLQLQLMMGGNAAARRALNIRRFGGQHLQAIEGNARIDAEREQPSTPVRHQDPLDDRQASIRKIEEVLTNPIEQNRVLLGEPETGSRAGQPRVADAILPPVKVTFPPDDAVTNQSLKRIVDIAPISELTFDSITLGKPHLDLIEQSSELMSLTLNQCRLDPVALRTFRLPPQIRSVSLIAMPLDESLTEKLENVESLGLSECTVDDAMIDAVSQLGVRILALSEIKFTQSSFKNLLSAPQLGYVTLAQCEFDLEWVRDLKTRRPALNIQAQPKAFLGIGQAGEDSCLIARVIGGSGAERAGVKVGDLMLSIDDQEVKRFEEVRLMIAQKRVDQKVKIVVAREGKPLELDVTLGVLDANIR